MKLVTAIITTYKRSPELVERALRSVLNQTYPSIEIILVDDSPVEYALRTAVADMAGCLGVKYIPHEKNQGACAARNTGLAHAAGEFVAFLDDDDEWEKSKIAKQMECFTSDEIALVYCGRKVLWEETGEISIGKTQYIRGDIYEHLIVDNVIGSTSFPLIRKSALNAIGGFDVQMESSQDLDVWLRLAQRYKVDYVEEPLVIYHFHEGEQITKNHKKRIAGLERINLKNQEYLSQNRYAWWLRHAMIIPHYAKDGQLKEALALWWRCVKKCPWKAIDNARYLRGLLMDYYDSKRKNKG